MSNNKKESSALGQIFVAVAVALLAGGTAPWWWDKIFLPKPPSRTVSASPSRTTEVSPEPSQTPQLPSDNEQPTPPLTDDPNHREDSKVTPLEIATYYRQSNIAALRNPNNIRECEDINIYPESPNFSEDIDSNTFCVISYTVPSSLNASGDTGAGLFWCSLTQEQNQKNMIRRLIVDLVDYGEHKVSIEGIVARIHRSIAPDYERVLSPSDDNDDIFLAECRIVSISRIP